MVDLFKLSGVLTGLIESLPGNVDLADASALVLEKSAPVDTFELSNTPPATANPGFPELSLKEAATRLLECGKALNHLPPRFLKEKAFASIKKSIHGLIELAGLGADPAVISRDTYTTEANLKLLITVSLMNAFNRFRPPNSDGGESLKSWLENSRDGAVRALKPIDKEALITMLSILPFEEDDMLDLDSLQLSSAVAALRVVYDLVIASQLIERTNKLIGRDYHFTTVTGERFRVVAELNLSKGAARIRYNPPNPEDLLLELAVTAVEGDGLLDLGYLVRAAEYDGLVDVDKVTVWAVSHGSWINPAFLRLGHADEFDRFASLVSKKQASAVENEISRINEHAVIKELEARRRVAIRQSACEDCSTVSEEEIEEMKKAEEVNLDIDVEKLFKRAEEFWNRTSKENISWLEIPEKLRGVKGIKDRYKVSSELAFLLNMSALPVIGDTMRAFWYVGDPEKSGDSGYIGWLKNAVSGKMAFGSYVLPYAKLYSDLLFEPKDVKIPSDPLQLAEFNAKTGQNIFTIFKLAQQDQFFNQAGLFMVGVTSALFGIYLAGLSRGALTAMMAEAGWLSEELAWTTWLKVNLTTFASDTIFFTLGSEAGVAGLTGIPTPADFSKKLGTNALVFSGIPVLGWGLRSGFGVTQRAAAGAFDTVLNGSLEAAESVLASGRSLRALRFSLGDMGGGIGILYGASYFATLAAYLETVGIPLARIGFIDPTSGAEAKGMGGLTQRLSALAIVCAGARALPLDNNLLRSAEARRKAGMLGYYLQLKAGAAYELRSKWAKSARASGGEFDPAERMVTLRNLAGEISLLLSERVTAYEGFAPSRGPRTSGELLSLVEGRFSFLPKRARRWFEAYSSAYDSATASANTVQLLDDVLALTNLGRLAQNGTLIPRDANAFAGLQSSFNKIWGDTVQLNNYGKGYRFEVIGKDGRSMGLFLQDSVFTPYPDMETTSSPARPKLRLVR